MYDKEYDDDDEWTTVSLHYYEIVGQASALGSDQNILQTRTSRTAFFCICMNVHLQYLSYVHMYVESHVSQHRRQKSGSIAHQRLTFVKS